MKQKQLYQCIRCGYSTNDKTKMRKHLYSLKKPCSGHVNDIELSDVIKETILKNKLYKIPEERTPQQIINQTINNYQQINNLINTMDTIEKINRYNEYKNLELIDFEDRIETQFAQTARKLDGKMFRDFKLNFASIMEVIDSVTLMVDTEKMNVLYDEIPNKLKIFCYGEWKCLLLEAGIKEIIEKIQACYLDYYECYLHRKLVDTDSNVQYRVEIRERLEEYYKFLAYFNILPYIHGKNNYQVLYSQDDPKYNTYISYNDYGNYSIQDEWLNKYNDLKDSILLSDFNRIKKEVQTIIKKNTKASILELNKKMMEIIQMDENFKIDVIRNITCISDILK